MSKYKILHSCGHEEVHEIYGTDVDGQRRKQAEWLRTRPCTACQKADLERAERWEQEAGISPSMPGTPAQVAWARKIRAQILDTARFQAATPSEMRPAAVAWLCSHDAEWWIDHQDAAPEALVTQNWPAIAAYAKHTGKRDPKPGARDRNDFLVLIRGRRACFTRPDLHTERVSYPVITPSAACGILRSVYGKPAFEWKVDSILVLNQIKTELVRMNEVRYRADARAARAAMKAGRGSICVNPDIARTQRDTLYLKDVAYVIRAHQEPVEDCWGPRDNVLKHIHIAYDRLTEGQCWQQPCLGVREFPARVELLEGEGGVPESFYVGTGRQDFGLTYYGRVPDGMGALKPAFFDAVMTDGLIDVKGAEVLS